MKEFFACNGCFGLFTKIENGSGISFCRTFSACFFNTNAPYLILYQLTKFQCHIFSFSMYQIKRLIKFLFIQLMTSSALRFIFDHPLKHWPRGEMRGSQKYKTINLENEKVFLNEIKSIFHNYLRAIICWIKEQYWTQALSYLRILRNAIIVKRNP